MAVTSFSGLTINSPQVGIQISRVTDNSSDWSSPSLPNSTYFYDKTDRTVYFKNSNGTVYNAYDNSVSSYVIIGAAYTATTANSTIDISGNTFTLTLYTAVNNSGRTVYVKNSGSGIVTVDANASENIDGQLNRTLANDEALFLQSNGSNWVILNAAPIQITFGHAATGTLSNSTTYYIGQDFSVAPSTTDIESKRVISLKSGWITRVSQMATWSTNDTGNNTLRIKNVTTNVTSIITSTLKYNAPPFLTDYILGTPLQVTRGDKIQLELVTPTFATAPGSLRQAFNVLVE